MFDTYRWQEIRGMARVAGLTGLTLLTSAAHLSVVAAQAAGQPQTARTAATRTPASATAAAAEEGVPQPTPLPDVPLVGRNGIATTSGRIAPVQGQWLLIQIQQGCGACDALLNRIQGEAWTNVPPRLAIVVAGATPADVERLAATFPALQAAAWYADETGRLASTLQINEAPVVLAIRSQGIQWTLSGVLSGSKRMQDVLTNWVALPADALSRTAAAPRE